MLFNLDKCAVMHFGFNNFGESMELGEKLLVSHTSERDLGVIAQSNLKVDMQCNKAACKANRRLGMIKRNFRFKSRSVMSIQVDSEIAFGLLCAGMETSL